MPLNSGGRLEEPYYYNYYFDAMMCTENRAAQLKLCFVDPPLYDNMRLHLNHFDIRLKTLVAISTVQDAKFEFCKYT